MEELSKPGGVAGCKGGACRAACGWHNCPLHTFCAPHDKCFQTRLFEASRADSGVSIWLSARVRVDRQRGKRPGRRAAGAGLGCRCGLDGEELGGRRRPAARTAVEPANHAAKKRKKKKKKRKRRLFFQSASENCTGVSIFWGLSPERSVLRGV